VSGISCHVLDTALGHPAAGIGVRLDRLTGISPDDGGSWSPLARAVTNTDGRAAALEAGERRVLGLHRITFETEEYFRRTGQAVFYPSVVVQFIVASPDDNYHVPLLLSPFGYTTYRGS
jgi:5-hydroxyisourate hydrolase